jgi:hypothetical protein
MKLLRRPRRLTVCLLAAAVVQSAGGKPPAADKFEVKYPALLSAKPRPEAPGDDEPRKLLKARYNAALAAARDEYAFEEFVKHRGPSQLDDPDGRYAWLKRFVDAGLDLCDTPAEKVAILANYLEVTKELERLEKVRYEAGRSGVGSFERTRYERLDAEIQLLRARREANGAKNK